MMDGMTTLLARRNEHRCRRIAPRVTRTALCATNPPPPPPVFSLHVFQGFRHRSVSYVSPPASAPAPMSLRPSSRKSFRVLSVFTTCPCWRRGPRQRASPSRASPPTWPRLSTAQNPTVSEAQRELLSKWSAWLKIVSVLSKYLKRYFGFQTDFC